MVDALLENVFPIPARTFVGAIVVVAVIHVVLLTIPLLIYLERKLSAYIQDRIGPNRTGFDFGLPFLKSLFRGFGFWGLGQSAADGLKFLLKEDYAPRGADKALFTLAPAAAVVPAMIGWAVIPWGGAIEIGDIYVGGFHVVEAGRSLVAAADVNIGFIYLLAIASLSIYGVVLGGWASNNKYSFLGGLRCSAGMISYEIPLGLTILTIVLTAGSVNPSSIIEGQVAGGWYVLAHPLAALLFFICILAEANRLPFDNAEAESELVGGYHTEYSAMRFALFFLGEYAHMITSSAFLVVLFFGGYHLPFVPLTSPEATGLLAVFAKFNVFMLKVLIAISLMMVIRWTIPRMRYDQVMRVCWQGMIPLTIVLVVATSIMLFFGWTNILALLAMNVVLTIGAMVVGPMLPGDSANRRVPLAGSRFSPLPGERVVTGPSTAVALDESGVSDRGQGIVSVH